VLGRNLSRLLRRLERPSFRPSLKSHEKGGQQLGAHAYSDLRLAWISRQASVPRRAYSRKYSRRGDLRRPTLNARPPFWLSAFVIIVSCAFWLLQPIILTYDTLGYLEAGRFFTSFSFRDWSFSESFTYWRMPLFPLLLTLTGAVQGWTVRVLVLVHLASAILMPILIYYGLSWIDRKAARR
jgi:hypothetical protein